MTISVIRFKEEHSLFGLRSSYYSEALVKVARIVPGLGWRKDLKSWVGYPDAIEIAKNLLVKNKIRVDGEELDPGVWGEPIALPSEKDLREYQKRGVQFLLTHAGEGCILADEMSCGKSAQTVRAARAWRAKTLIVCPKFVRGVWIEEFEKWWPEASVGVLEKDLSVLQNTNMVVVTHYDILHRFVERIRKDFRPRLIAFDEVHMLMSETSRRSEAARDIACSVPLRIGLSGTPMTNRPRDLWNVIETLSPGRFGGKFFAFGLRYCDGRKEQVTPEKTVWKFDGASNSEELKRRLSFFMLRRTTDEVLPELPPIARQIIWLDTAKSTKPWTGGVKSLKELRGLLDRAADRKLPEVLKLVENVRENYPNDTVVVFCYRRSVTEWFVDQLRAQGETASAIHGGLPTSTRTKRLEEAKAWKGGVLIVTIDSCGVGISLAFARAAVFAELSYEPWKLRQAERRVARFGQKASSVLVQYSIARGTADELVLGKVISKLDVEGGLGLGDSGKFRSELSGKDEERVLNEIYSM